MTRRRDTPPALTPAEERILRLTIDDPRNQIFDVPAKTVRRLLVLIDELRKVLTIHAAADRIAGGSTAERIGAGMIDEAQGIEADDDPFDLMLRDEAAADGDPIRTIGFVTNPSTTVRLAARIDHGNGTYLQLLGDRTAIIDHLREHFASACFQMPTGVFRAGAEIADLLERDHLP